MIITIHSAYTTSKQSLVDNYLNNNYDRASDLASSTGDLLDRIQGSVNAIAEIWQRNHGLDENQMRDLYDTHREYFNSLSIIRKDHMVAQTAPADGDLHKGASVNNPTSRAVIKMRDSVITDPFVGTTGNLMVLVTSPLFDENNQYYGYVAGTIYLHKSNILQLILEREYELDGSYVYAVDAKGNIIFHPDRALIGKNVASNDAVWKVIAGLNGSMLYSDSQHDAYYAGYAYNMKSGWGIISQTPASVVNVPLGMLLQQSILQSLPLLLITLAAGWLLTYLVVKPLHQLASYSDTMVKDWNTGDFPPIRSATYEIKTLYNSLRFTSKQMQKYIAKLQNETALDGLTGLANRRNFDSTLDTWCMGEEPFALIMLDIDHFKRVNDTYGHLTGDRVMQFLAAMMRNVSREGDLCFRYGGEEFGILLRGCNITRAYVVAERLRQLASSTISPSGEIVTISIGIVACPDQGRTPTELISKADQALYTSKREGRNRSTIYADELLSTS
ncbi:sensor domain-containing diguanylate cyclase [Paenibacillus bovis]|nr:diguanylate cyclase [Paenibacillus bovis]